MPEKGSLSSRIINAQKVIYCTSFKASACKKKINCGFMQISTCGKQLAGHFYNSFLPADPRKVSAEQAKTLLTLEKCEVSERYGNVLKQVTAPMSFVTPERYSIKTRR